MTREEAHFTYTFVYSGSCGEGRWIVEGKVITQQEFDVLFPKTTHVGKGNSSADPRHGWLYN